MKCFVTGGSGFIGQYLISMLIDQGYEVGALARSEQSAAAIAERGATVIIGDMRNADTIHLKEYPIVFHVASTTDNYGDYQDKYDINVNGTIRLIKAAKEAGVKRMIYIGTAAIVLGRQAVNDVDETYLPRSEPKGIYRKTKAIAEKYVLNANSSEFETIVVRPPVVWGKGDKTILEPLSEAVKQNKLAWISKGDYLISVVHVKNLCRGIILAGSQGKPGEIYYFTDGEPVQFRSFFTRMLQTQDLSPSNNNISRAKALAFGYIVPFIWKMLRKEGRPPFDAEVVYMLGTQFTLSDSKARKELKYENIISMDEGLEEMRI